MLPDTVGSICRIKSDLNVDGCCNVSAAQQHRNYMGIAAGHGDAFSSHIKQVQHEGYDGIFDGTQFFSES